MENTKEKNMTSERIEEIQKQTAYPNSVSVYQALLQVWNECGQEITQLREQNERLKLMLMDLMNNPKDFKSGGWYEVSVPMDEIAQAEQLLKEIEQQ